MFGFETRVAENEIHLVEELNVRFSCIFLTLQMSSLRDTSTLVDLTFKQVMKNW